MGKGTVKTKGRRKPAGQKDPGAAAVTEAMLARAEACLCPSYEPALPFQIHESGDASPYLNLARPRADDESRAFEVYRRILHLSSVASGIADLALADGFRVSIPCDRNYAPDIAGAFAQRVPARTLVFYDDEGGRLVFRHENEDAIHRKREDASDK